MKTMASGFRTSCPISVILTHRILISTCSTLGNLLAMQFNNTHFTHVIVDEAGQCTEPEIMIPVCLASPYQQMILAGDPNQLSPIVINRSAEKNGLSQSFLERLLQRLPYLKDSQTYLSTSGYDPRVITKLLYSYRAIPSVLYYYNSFFYNGELQGLVKENSPQAELLCSLKSCLPSDLYNPRDVFHGTFFIGCNGTNRQREDSPSWYNREEAVYTVQLFKNLMASERLEPSDIGIIAPYQSQIKLIKEIFRNTTIEVVPKVGSVEEFQGQERNVIILSTVRSSTNYISSDLRYSLGFLSCPKRINVAVSRARCALIVIGNTDTLSKDMLWNEYISYCKEKGAYAELRN